MEAVQEKQLSLTFIIIQCLLISDDHPHMRSQFELDR